MSHYHECQKLIYCDIAELPPAMLVGHNNLSLQPLFLCQPPFFIAATPFPVLTTFIAATPSSLLFLTSLTA